MKLWDKGQKISKEAEKFSVGNDYLLDRELVKYDCIASIAHVKMLKKIGVLSSGEEAQLIGGLNEIIKLHEEGKFEIFPEDEDCHTAIENYLCAKHGEAGKKIHAARSRNDQVLTALRLYEKSKLEQVQKMAENFKLALGKMAKEYGEVEFPGYTHMRKAMPTTIGAWAGSYVDSMDDNLKMIGIAMQLIDKSPLGTGAGFGIPVFEIDREMVAKELGFASVLENPIYAQAGRGKLDSFIVHILLQIMHDLNKLSSDLILFSMDEFGYVRLPDEFCMGSSIMPQKKNPDVLELVRANYYVVLGEQVKISGIIGNLISGYNRDLQLCKEPVFKSFKITQNCLKIMALLVPQLKIDKEKCKKALTKEMYAAEEACQLTKQGMSFREAYREAGKGL